MNLINIIKYHLLDNYNRDDKSDENVPNVECTRDKSSVLKDLGRWYI